jgi:hypothetical protein
LGKLSDEVGFIHQEWANFEARDQAAALACAAISARIADYLSTSLLAEPMARHFFAKRDHTSVQIEDRRRNEGSFFRPKYHIAGWVGITPSEDRNRLMISVGGQSIFGMAVSDPLGPTALTAIEDRLAKQLAEYIA